MRLIFVFFLCLSANVIQAQSPCQSENHRAFDFWIGTWEVTLANTNQIAGYNHISLEMDSCVIKESWTGTKKSRGESFNHYEPSIDKWKQKWVDNGGNNLEFTGTIKNDTATFFATTLNPKNKIKITNRMVIAKKDKNTVIQIWDQQTPDGQWNTVFHGIYKRMSPLTLVNKEVQAVYDSFSVAYKTLNQDMLIDLYNDEAVYLPPGQKILKGKSEIARSFDATFENHINQKGELNIEFDILDRRIEGDVVIDSGYFTYRSKYPGKTETISKGKFLTILKKEKDGKWRFIYDSYNSAPMLKK